MSRIRFSRKHLAIPYALFLVLFVVLPLFLIVYYAFTDSDGNFSFANLTMFFSNSTRLTVLINSIIIGAFNTALCILIGYPIAMILSNRKYNKSGLMFLLFIMPMWINFVLRTAATRDLLFYLGIDGATNPLFTTMVGLVYNYLPFAILPMYTTMLKMDKSLIEASYDLGANKRTTFVKTILPMTMPGVVSAATMVFMPTMSAYVICDILGNGKVYLIGKSIQESFDNSLWNIGSFMALVMLAMIGISLLITKNVKKEEDARGSIW